MKNVLKVWLRKNDLTPDPNDYSAVVSSAGSIDKEGLVDAVMEEGTEYKRETVLDIVTRYNRQSARYALSGWNVNNGLVYLRPVVTGTFYSKKFDPSRNSVYVSAVQGADMRLEAAQTSVEILGEMPETMYIIRVTNLATKTTDSTITRGRNVQVEGTHIKVAGDHPSVGIYLINAANGAETKLDDDHIATNDPSKLMILIPDNLPGGTYRLRIISQFTSGNKLLKSPHQAEFSQELILL